MTRRRSLASAAAAAIVGLALGAGTATEAAAGADIRFGNGQRGHAQHHRPRYSHGVPFIHRKHLYDHGVPFGHRKHLYGHHRHPPQRHFHRHRHHRRHVLGAGCSPAVQRFRDHHGRLVIHHVTVCRDRHGRPYVLGGGR